MNKEEDPTPSPVDDICPVCKQKKDIFPQDIMLNWDPRCAECWDKRYDEVDQDEVD